MKNEDVFPPDLAAKKKGRNLKITLLLLSMHTIMAAAIVAPVLPSIEEAFVSLPGADLMAKLLLSLPPIFVAITAPFAGRYIDRHGRLPLLYLGLVIYVISGTSGLYLNDLFQILVGRALLGISIGIILTVAITLIGDYFEGQARQRFVGLQSAFIGVAGVFFLALGGVLGDIGWRIPFFIYGLAILMIPLVKWYLPEPRYTPQIDSKLPRLNRLMWLVFLTAILVMLVFYVIPTQLPFVLRDLGEHSSTLTGLVLALNALGLVISSLFYAQLKKHFSFAMIYVIGLGIMALGYWMTGITGSYLIIIVAMGFAGFGFGLLIPNTNLWIIELSPLESRGRNLGALNSFLFCGQFLSPIVFEPLTSVYGLQRLFVYCCVFLVLMGLFFLIWRRWLSRMEQRYAIAK